MSPKQVKIMENTLQESIRQAVENGQLDRMMSVFKMEAVKQKIGEDVLQQMIEKEKETFNLKKEAEEAKRLAEEAQSEALRQAQDLKAKELELQRKAVEAAKRNKYILWAVCAVLVILEWMLIFNAHPADGEKSHLFLTLIVNFVTLLLVVIGAAAFFRKRN